MILALTVFVGVGCKGPESGESAPAALPPTASPLPPAPSERPKDAPPVPNENKPGYPGGAPVGGTPDPSWPVNTNPPPDTPRPIEKIGPPGTPPPLRTDGTGEAPKGPPPEDSTGDKSK